MQTTCMYTGYCSDMTDSHNWCIAGYVCQIDSWYIIAPAEKITDAKDKYTEIVIITSSFCLGFYTSLHCSTYSTTKPQAHCDMRVMHISHMFTFKAHVWTNCIHVQIVHALRIYGESHPCVLLQIGSLCRQTGLHKINHLSAKCWFLVFASSYVTKLLYLY